MINSLPAATTIAPRTSWWPMAAIAMGQAQMSWNINKPGEVLS
jgi:hypothetical protein